ncbi:THUMP domain profile [Nakaseomyces glabratus]|nr:THUMP domain profile [Nakaseomyces glabratus]KAH7587922.1 THUMP domain profile [Nakaseomyces glabratus]KAH7592308.1 THUMP domain profile [Nakaseomyces glabratus]KAH7600954.1 THUMP domain profile [Nakaseomyces glabratus]KAH7613393.1 THUMP domain profile [Nakaseomyces glabratus]
MGTKRGNDGSSQNRKIKKFKIATGFLDPGTSGIYATCTRRKEKAAISEMGILLEEKIEELYGESEVADSDVDEAGSIEDEVAKELAQLKKNKDDQDKKQLLKAIDLQCECVVFFKTRKPVNPTTLVKAIIDDFSNPESKVKRTRYIQKLTPITYSCNATKEQFQKLIDQVVEPAFKSDQSYKFAVEVTRRNFNTMERMDIINTVVSTVMKHGHHKVDLKNYDKVIMVECFKNNIGMSVLDNDYSKKHKKYNLQQIYEAKFKDDEK